MAEAALLALMAGASALDIKTREIPNWLTVPTMAIAACWLGTVPACLAMIGVALLFYGDQSYLAKIEAIKGGDVKLLGMIGAFIGWLAIAAFIVSLALVKLYRMALDEHGALPYAPFAFLSTLIVLCATKATILMR